MDTPTLFRAAEPRGTDPFPDRIPACAQHCACAPAPCLCDCVDRRLANMGFRGQFYSRNAFQSSRNCKTSWSIVEEPRNTSPATYVTPAHLHATAQSSSARLLIVLARPSTSHPAQWIAHMHQTTLGRHVCTRSHTTQVPIDKHITATSLVSYKRSPAITPDSLHTKKRCSKDRDCHRQSSGSRRIIKTPRNLSPRILGNRYVQH